jgi:hypothetical protein
VKDELLDLTLWALASPILFVKWLLRLKRRWRFWRVAYMTQISCRSCHSMISLVGIWRCGCGFTYRGHLLRECPVCGALPRMVRCFACGITEKLPEP